MASILSTLNPYGGKGNPKHGLSKDQFCPQTGRGETLTKHTDNPVSEPKWRSVDYTLGSMDKGEQLMGLLRLI